MNKRGHDINSRAAYAAGEFAQSQLAVLRTIGMLKKCCCRSIAMSLGKQTSDVTGRLDELERCSLIKRSERSQSPITGKQVWLYELTEQGQGVVTYLKKAA